MLEDILYVEARKVGLECEDIHVLYIGARKVGVGVGWESRPGCVRIYCMCTWEQGGAVIRVGWEGRPGV